MSQIDHSRRIASIDIFRGLTILTMIFVNDLGHIKDVPWWLKHMPGDADGMTFVDVVFPAFLFIVGMAIPFAFRKRLQQGASLFQLWQHILLRTAGLLIIGVYMVNNYSLSPSLNGMKNYVWTFLLFTSVILVWNAYPIATDARRWFFLTLRLLGIAVLIYLAIIYRSRDGGWMKTSWWGILGLIGWAYLTSSTAYLMFRRHLAGLMGVLSLLILLYIGDKAGALNFLQLIKQYIWLGGHIGGHSSITVAGIIVAMLFLPDSPAKTLRQRIVWIFVFAAGLFVAGFLLRPLYGINKNLATPTWCLYSTAICCVLFVLIYWLVDVKQIIKPVNFVHPAGTNALLAYILPDIFYSLLAILGIKILNQYLNSGLLGIIRSALFALLMVAITGVLMRLRIILRL